MERTRWRRTRIEGKRRRRLGVSSSSSPSERTAFLSQLRCIDFGEVYCVALLSSLRVDLYEG